MVKALRLNMEANGSSREDELNDNRSARRIVKFGAELEICQHDV